MLGTRLLSGTHKCPGSHRQCALSLYPSLPNPAPTPLLFIYIYFYSSKLVSLEISTLWLCTADFTFAVV